ncbi:MAG: MFS transporter [Clostridia bacterium]|nr:MFS transporter [Clostridia bacterium]
MKKKFSSCRGLGKDYWLFWFASSFSMGASNILQYVLSLYVLDLTGSATLFASMLSIIIFPRILLTPLAGVLADRVSKIRMMSLILLGETVILVLYFLLGQTVTINIALVYLLVVALETGEIFYGGCEAAILPELVPSERLTDAISISKTDDGVVNVIAPMAAALIYDHLTIAAAFAVIAALNFGSFLMQTMIHPKYEAQHTGVSAKSSVWHDFIEGVHCIRKDPFLCGFIKVLPIVNAFFGATFSVSVAYLLRQTYAVDTWVYSAYCSVTSAVSMIVPLFAVPLVKKFAPNKLFFVATMSIAASIFLIGVCAVCGIYQVIPVMISVVIITLLDCMTIAAAMPMQMTSSIMLQTGVGKSVLGRVSATLRMISIASVAAGEMVFGLLNDATWVWLPIFLGAAGVAISSLLFRKVMGSQKVYVSEKANTFD